MNSLTPHDLIGSWTLQEWRIDYPDGRASAWPFGTDAIGLIVYGADGWMSATMSCRRRTTLSDISAVKADDASRARAFQEYLTYSGRWHIEDGRIAHDVEMALNPALLGTRQWREAQLRDGALLLAAEEPIGSGRTRRHQISWRRP